MRRSALLALLMVSAAAASVAAQPSAPAPQPAAPDRGQLDATKLSKVPRQTRFVAADYPPEAKQRGIEADVVLLLDLDDKGNVSSASVQQPASPPGLGFDEAAIVAAASWEFTPAEVDGKPIAVQISYRYHFTLSAAPPAAAPPPAPTASAASTTAPIARPARAGVINFSGRLIERGTRLPLAGMVVTVFRDDVKPPVGFDATADAGGQFVFYDLPPGDWKVLIEAPGYYPYRTTETIPPGLHVDATYYVEKGSYNPYDVTVTGTRPRKEVSRTVLSAAEIDKVPGGAGDPLAVVQNFAGVALTDRPGELAVRGSAPEDTQIFVDGIAVPLIYHFGGLKSVLPIGMLSSIEFYPGNFSPMYGRATGGIIDVRIKNLAPKKIGGYVDISILDSGFYLEAPIGKDAAIAIAARRSYIDAILSAVIPKSSGVTLTTAPRYYDYQLLATWRPRPAHDLRLFVFGSDDRLALLLANPAKLDPSFDGNDISNATTFQRAIAQYDFVPSTRVDNSLKLAVGHDIATIAAGTLAFDQHLTSIQLRDALRTKLTRTVALTLGVDAIGSIDDLFVRLPRPQKEGEPQTRPDLTDLITTERHGDLTLGPAAFAEAELEPVPGLLILPGVRVYYFGTVHDNVVQPRLTARWAVSDPVTVKAGVGLFAEEPQIDETDKQFGNPDLKSEKAWHFSAGTEWKAKSWLTLDATAFYKVLTDLVSPTTTLVTDADGTTHPLVYDNNGKGRVIGLELQARHDFAHNVTGWVAYTLSRSERRDSGQLDYRLFDYDQTHILTIVGAYVLPRNWQVSGRLRLISGDPLTPVIGSVYDAGADRYDPIYGLVNSVRNPLFNQLDVRVDKRWIYRDWTLNAYLDIQNIYDAANSTSLQYNYDYTQSKGRPGIPILPILGLRGEF